MNLRTNLMIGGVFLALLAFVYWHEIRGGERRAEEARLAKQLLSFPSEAAKRLTVERGDTVAVLERIDDQWRLLHPVIDRADQQALSRYLRTLRESERERVVADSAEITRNTAHLERYGLDRPRLRVALELDDGTLDTLAFGDDSPTESHTYVQHHGDNPEVFVVPAWRFDNLNKGVFDLRDRRVLPFERRQVAEIRLLRPEQAITLMRNQDDETWQITSPIQGRADAEAVRRILSRLQDGEVAAYVAEPDEISPEALTALGLEPAHTLEVVLLSGPERAEKRLRIGSESPSGRYFARDMSSERVFEVDNLLVSDLDQSLKDLRDRTVLQIQRTAISRVAIERPDEPTVALVRDSDGVWSVELPEPLPVRSWEIESLLSDLTSLEAHGFAEPADPGYREAPFLLSYMLSGTDDVAVTVRFSGDPDVAVYASIDTDPTVYRIDLADFADLDLILEDLADIPDSPTGADVDYSSVQP